MKNKQKKMLIDCTLRFIVPIIKTNIFHCPHYQGKYTHNAQYTRFYTQNEIWTLQTQIFMLSPMTFAHILDIS